MDIIAPLQKESIGQEFRKELSIQDYVRKGVIEGVQLLSLNHFVDDGGAFAEIARLDEEGNLQLLPHFKVRQTNYSVMLPGVIKAFHLHYNQEDVWFVMPYDRVLVGLFDAREKSPTYKTTMRFVMGAGKAQLLYLPRGVAHGLANVWQNPSTLVYFVNQHFNADCPDEHRLPWNILGDNFWEIHKG